MLMHPAPSSDTPSEPSLRVFIVFGLGATPACAFALELGARIGAAATATAAKAVRPSTTRRVGRTSSSSCRVIVRSFVQVSEGSREEGRQVAHRAVRSRSVVQVHVRGTLDDGDLLRTCRF